VVLAVSALHVASDSRPAFSVGSSIDDEATALAAVSAYTGLELSLETAADSQRIKVDKEVVTDSRTPFLSEAINGRTAWVVSVSGVVLQPEVSDDSLERANPKNFVISVDSSDGRLLRGVLFNDGVGVHERVECPVKEAEQQLHDLSGEDYIEIPEELPELTLLKALDEIELGSPAASAWGTFRYVLHSRRNLGVKPAWVIHLYMGYEGKLSHMRYAINARTGRERVATNMPKAGLLEQGIGH
jgi:hypothetical protein